jgi:16S rRNA G966 N2-methylase RsmD
MNQAECKDIMDYQSFPEYDMIWCDPPWEDGMVKYFQTLNKKQTGKEVSNQIDGILDTLFRLAHKGKPIAVEYSVKGHERVIRYAEKYGHVTGHTTYAKQENGITSVIIFFNTDCSIPDNVVGYANTIMGVQQIGAKHVFDPFAGVGRTGRAVLKAGATYHGSELNEYRYNKLKMVLGIK